MIFTNRAFKRGNINRIAVDMKRNLERAITGWLQTLSDFFRSHKRKPSQTAHNRECQKIPRCFFFFFLGSRSGHLKTPMTKYDFFFLYQGCHDRTPQKHLKIILAHNICRNSVAQLFTAHVKQSALKTVKVGQRKTKT